MVVKLIVRVQADLLPQFKDAEGNIVSQVGLRLSALVDLPAGETLGISPDDLLVDLSPWRWLSADPSVTWVWNPHRPEAWRLFRLDGVKPVEIVTKTTPAGLDPGMNGDFAAAVDQTLEMIIDEGSEATFCLPPENQQIEHRTVFGMVESLTGLPHPVPAGMRVFTVLSVAEDLKDARLVAIPRFSLVKGGGFDIDKVSFVDIDPESVVTAEAAATDASKWASTLRFELRASLTQAVMARTENSARLIDLSTLSIGRNHIGTETGDEDYAAHLPAKLAEAVDPAARLIGAFDRVIETLRKSRLKDDQDIFAALRLDLANREKSALLTLFDAMTFDVFQPMARASAAALPIALSRFGLLAREGMPDSGRTATAWSAGQVFLRMLDRDESGVNFAMDRARPPLISYARLATTVGIPPEEIAEASKEPPPLDSEAGLLAFVRDHWIGPFGTARDMPRPVTIGMPRELAAKTFTAATLDLQMVREPVLDIAMLAAPGPRFQLSLASTGDSARLKIGTIAVDFIRGAGNKIAVTANGGGPIEVVPDIDVLIFSLTVKTDRITLLISFDGDAQELEVAAPALSRAPFSITLEAIAGKVGDFQPCRPEPVQALGFGDMLTAPGVRGELSLAFVGPYLPGILAGQQSWLAAPAAASPQEDFSKAIRDGVAALVPALYSRLSQAVANPPWLDSLAAKVINLATEDAVRMAVAAVPSGALERITMDAPPLVVRIDQFQDFGSEDAWGRVAGYGALLGRTVEPPSYAMGPDEWWTLNAAELFAVMPKNPSDPKKPGDPKYIQVVDPVAIQVGQGGGVRQSLLSYNNRWLTTGLATDMLQDDDDKQPSVPRRPEKLLPPSKKAGYLLPALSFGYSFWVLPYLIGHGGALPLWLRADMENPLVRRGTLGRRITDTLKDVLDDVRSKTYLRTRPIGAPRLVETPEKPALPGVPDNVLPLAGELALRPAPITLEPGQSAMYFRDVSGQRGTLSWLSPAAEELAGFRLMLGDVCKPGSTYEATRTAVGELTVTLWGAKDDSMVSEQLWTTTLKTVVDDLRLSFLIDKVGDLTILVERQSQRPRFAEDEGVFEATAETVKAVLEWRDMFLEIAVPGAGQSAQFEPPVAVGVQRGVKDDLKSVGSLIVGKPHIAPEAGHRSRVVSLFDGIRKIMPDAVTIRRPGVEFGTYERWINPALIETAGGPEKQRDIVAKALSAAYNLSTREPGSGGVRREVGFEDPAVTAFCFELVEIFPYQSSIGIQVTKEITGGAVFAWDAGTATTGDRRLAQLTFDYAASPQLMSTSNGVKAILQPGRIYELRTYAAIAGARQDFSPFDTLARLSKPVLATLRKVNVNGKDYLLSSPNVVTIEVASDELPDVYEKSGWSQDGRLVLVDRPPAERDDTARIYLPVGLTGAEVDDYRKVRYAARASLYSQRWSWRGYPQAEIPSRDGKGLLNSEWTAILAETAFTGRRDDDVGDVIVRRLEKAHIYGGRGNLSEKLPTPPSTALFTKALDWRAGLNLWRFGFSLTSRYGPLFPRQTSPERLAHLGANGSAWAVQVVPDRTSRRTIVRPGLALVLPLTEPLMAGGAAPPLLALFNERVHANFNLADGIDVAVEVARHPFTFEEQKTELVRLQTEEPDKEEAIRDLEHRLGNHIFSPTDRLKYWQEFGPDPIRTGGAHDGSPILLRTDGPLGYTFDAETEAGRFDHAGLLLSPVAQDYQPWSMIKLRFRRLEAPEALSGFEPVALSAKDKQVPLAGNRFPPGPGAAVDYEGLLVDLELKHGEATEIALSIGTNDPRDPESEAQPTVTVAFSREAGSVTISTRTLLGEAGSTRINVASYESVALRLVVSGRERPEGIEQWTPQGDVAIKLKIANPQLSEDVLERLDRDRWLAVNCVPLSGSKAIGQKDVVHARLRNTPRKGKAPATLVPARLSPFTPSVWCQFTESMSILSVTLGKDNDQQTRRVSVNELAAKWNAGDGGLELSLRPIPGEAKPPAIRSLATSFTTDVDAQVDQILLAVITRYVTDAFARLRERPIGIVHLTDDENRPLLSPDANEAFIITLKPGATDEAWWSGEAKPPQRGKGGRLRFLRMLVPRSRQLGGFAETTTRRLETLFNRDLIVPDDLNPADAAGQILGISQPVEWQ
ncbi:hypothetical protein [Rhizobium phaseoli]|uniref:hypothetical protein n=1 Tax=Rhizobium phaseoli TaxID=396 RepID=UPI000BE910AC|nr:hypothetical protein [Rhizobium phaseoli]PDS69867.1 hypothetical protein CO651_21880 [Rhizobium phaseoli]